MDQTPQLRSAFPSTPRAEPHRRRLVNNGQTNFSSPETTSPPSHAPSPITRPIRILSEKEKVSNSPLIPFDVVDPPTQRLYVVGFYIVLTAWRMYNTWQITDDLDSSWQFLKWTGIDAAFFIALPAFQIPWLEFSFTTTVALVLLHFIANAFLMFQIPIPVFSWIAAFTKVVYDRELSISEQRVKPADILHNSSIILGKQIIHILPEGSAILNPRRQSFCLDSHTTSITLPIQINQTAPISIDLVRYDLETDEEENISISARQARQLKSQADKGFAKIDVNTPRTLQYAVSKPGLYHLAKVIDESKLEVRRRSYDVTVVKCPTATISSSSEHGCAGDLSKIAVEVSGVPPFKVKYNKRINQQQFSSIVQSIQQPNDDEDSSFNQPSTVLDPARPPLGRTKSKIVSFDINEVLNNNGSWTYGVEEVEDGLGNKVSYAMENEKELARRHRTAGLTVHNRPIADLAGCDTTRPLRVASGDFIKIPVRIRPIGQFPAADWPLKLKYSFIPEGEGPIPAIDGQLHEMIRSRDVPSISKAGRYSIESVESQYCTGEVVEPSSCSLLNPPKPSLALASEEVFDRCAGNPIGMVANLDLTGTPPFKVRYTVTHRGVATPKIETIDSMRSQLTFMEKSAGSYVYQFLEIEDGVYNTISLKDDGLILKQDIRPPAWAGFVGDGSLDLRGCLGQSIDLPVRFSGTGPWELEYEILYGGKRKKRSLQSDIDTALITLTETAEGGKYSVVLTSVQDSVKCKTSLNSQRAVQIRAEQPRAAFGDIDGQRSLLALEGKTQKLPIRLQGAGPWQVEVKNPNDNSKPALHTFGQPNGDVQVDQPGTYEIVSVRDSCPGFVDPKANMFTVSWVSRPKLNINDPSVTRETPTNLRKAPVCRGDESTLALSLSGNAPYHLKYTQKFEPLKGSAAISNKPLSLAGNSAQINLETSKAGEYSYEFNELSDDRYSHDRRRFKPMIVRQQIYALPSAIFTFPGKTFGYCKDDPNITGPFSDSEQIPITLTGTPPFAIEIAISHHGLSTRPEIIRINSIPTNSYTYSLSRSSLDLGSHSLSIRSVKDNRGCQSILESDPSSVRVSVSSPPTINPLESTSDYCVGNFMSFSLSGQAPFEIFYNFQSRDRKARVTTSEFRRITDHPGEFIITGISDSAMGGGGKCRATKEIRKTIHPYPSAMINMGKTRISDIHEGGDVEMTFEFTGTPPFEFTYTRSETLKGGKTGAVLETRHDTSHEFTKKIRASEEGTYEVVAIKDRFCSYSRDGGKGSRGGGGVGGKAQKLLQL